MFPFKKNIIRADIFPSLIFFILFSLSFSNDLQFEKRCLWVVRNTLKSKSSIDELIEFSSKNNFNHIFVQVRGRGDSFYESSIVPRSEILTVNDFDPLAYTIEKAKIYNIKVHAWVNVYMLWSSPKKPQNKNHLFNRKANWIDVVKSESFRYSLTLDRLTSDISGKEGFYLSPNNPFVNAYLFSVFKELVNNYKIDGLHLDYVRYKNQDYGFNYDALDIYQGNYFTKNDNLLDLKLIESAGLNNSLKWEEFLLNSVTELIIKLKSYITNNIDNKIILSAAVKPNIVKANKNFYQEWDMWLNGSIIDWILVMNYNSDLISFANNIQIIEENVSKNKMKNIIMGIALYNQNQEDAKKKIYYSYNAGFSGVCLFSYNVFNDQKNKFDDIFLLLKK